MNLLNILCLPLRENRGALTTIDSGENQVLSAELQFLIYPSFGKTKGLAFHLQIPFFPSYKYYVP